MGAGPKKYIKIYGVFSALLIFLAIMSQFSLVYISKPDSTNNPTVTRKELVESAKENTRFGFNFVKKGNYVFEVKDQNSLSRKTVKTRAFGLHKVSLSLSPQKNVSKIANDTKACVYGSETELRKGNVYSYDCPFFNQSAFSSYSKGQTITRGGFLNLEQAVSYGEGVVGIKKIGDLGEEEDGTPKLLIQYVDSNTLKSLIVEGLNYADESTTKLVVWNEKIYIFDQLNKKIAYLDSFAEDKKAVIFDVKTPGNEYRLISVSALDNKLYLYSIQLGGEGEQIISGLFTTYQLSNQIDEVDIKITDQKLLNDYLGEFVNINNEVIASYSTENGGSLIIIGIKRDSLEVIDVISDTLNSFIAKEGRVYSVSTDGRVFVYDAKEKYSRMVFGSEHSTISSIKIAGNNFIIKGISEINSPEANRSDVSYLIDGFDAPSVTRIYDILPHKLTQYEIPVVFIDYFGKEILVEISPLATLEKTDNQIKQDVLSYLNSKKIDIDSYSIVYR